MYTIGQLAKRHHVTVSTLRYYEQIGLLQPSTITESGRSRYDNDAALKLQNILLLKEMGLTLDVIEQIIENNMQSPKQLLHTRLQMIEAEQAELASHKVHIEQALRLMELEQTEQWQTVFETYLQPTYNRQALASVRNGLFTKQEHAMIDSMPTVAESSEQAACWRALIIEAKQLVNDEPTSAKAQQLAEKWVQQMEQTYASNWALAQKWWAVDDREAQRLYRFQPDVKAFIERAITYYYEQRSIDVHE